MSYKKRGALRLSALVCQSVGGVFMVVFCAQLLGAVSDQSAFLDTIGLRFVAPLVKVLAPCAAAAAIFVTLCLWLMFLGRTMGRRLLSVSILVQLVVEALIFGLILFLLLVISWSAQGQALMDALELGGVMTKLVLGVAVMAAVCVFLHTVALRRARGAAPDRTAAIACFVAGSVHAITLLVLVIGLSRAPAELTAIVDDAVERALFFLLAGFAAADILYGAVTLRAAKK